jgi:hypothetical protein
LLAGRLLYGTDDALAALGVRVPEVTATANRRWKVIRNTP